MTKVNFSAARKKAEESGLLGGGSAWKPKDGANVIRLVSECLEHPGEFKGPDGKVKKTFKWLCFILDRNDGEVKPYFMPNTVYEQIEDYQLNPDYGFDEVPMPYDITLNVRNAGKLDVDYKVVAARTNTSLTAEEQQKIAAKGSIRAYQQTVYEGRGGVPEQPERTIVLDEPPMPDRYKDIPPDSRPRAGA